MSSQAANDLRTAYLRDGFAVVHRFVESEEIVSLQSSIADLATSVARSLGVPSNPLVFDHDLVRHWSETENLHPRFRASLARPLPENISAQRLHVCGRGLGPARRSTSVAADGHEQGRRHRYRSFRDSSNLDS
jgi:hypothetical protein